MCDEVVRAGSPPPTPAPTREQVRHQVNAALRDANEPFSFTQVNRIADAVMALLSESAPPLWTGETRGEAEIGSYLDATLRVPPGTAVEVRPASPSAVTPPTDPRPALHDALTRIVGDIGAIDDDASRRTAAHMLRHYGAEVREKRP